MTLTNSDDDQMKDIINIQSREAQYPARSSDDDDCEQDLEKQDQQQEQQQQQQLPQADQPPDGGLLAWSQVIAGFFCFFNSWGIVNAFGAYQNYYEHTMMKDQSPSTIAWIGSIQAFMVMSVPVLTGRLLDGGYLKHVLIFGSFMLVFGLMMCSLASEFYQVLLTQGICVGIGSACLFSSGVATVAPYFKRRRATAIGLVASGSSIGGVTYPIMAQQLIPKLGFPWATRVIAFMILGLCIPVCLVMKSRLPPRRSGPWIDYPSFKDYPFILFSFGALFNFIGLYVPIFFVETWAQSHGIQKNVATYILSILNAGSVLGRIVPNIIADKTGNLNIMIPCVAIAGILTFVWIGISSTAGIIVFAVIYGFMSGVLVSMPPAVISNMTPDMSKIGTRLGMNFALCSIGVLLGAPVAGAIINRMDGKYLGAQIFGGVSVFVGVALMSISRMLFTKGKFITKA